MKKIIILFATILSGNEICYSQWQLAGADIYNTNAGNVGIGITSPPEKLSLLSNTVGVGINLQSSGNYSYIKGNSGSATGLNNFNRFEIFGNSSSSNGPSVTMIGNDNQYPNRNGSVSFCSYGTSGAGLFFQNYNTTTGIWENHMSMDKNGKVIIGSSLTWNSIAPGDYKLYVERGILSEKVKVAIYTTGDWADHVFQKDYKLPSFDELSKYIRQNGHLPGIPSAEEMVKNGNDLAKTDAKLLEKIEELTLYVIQLNDENKKLKTDLEKLKASTSLAQLNETLLESIELLKKEIEQLRKEVAAQK